MSSTTVSSPTVCNSTVPTTPISASTVSTPTASSTTISASIIRAPNVTATAIAAPPITTSSTSLASLEKKLLAQFWLNHKRFSSFEEIFHHIGQQPQEDQWALTQSLLQFRSGVVYKFVQFDSKLLKHIEEQKAWQFIDLDKNTLKVHLGPLKKAVKSAERGAAREMNNRMKIWGSWGPEVSTLFETSTRNEVKEIAKVVEKYPTHKDARDRINNLIIMRLSDKNIKPTPQKVFTRTGDWIQVGEVEFSADPIPYKVLEQLNIRLGPHDVLEFGLSPLPPTVAQTPKQITGPENFPFKEENQNSGAPGKQNSYSSRQININTNIIHIDFSVPPLLFSLTHRYKENPKGEKRKKDSHEEESEESSSSDYTSFNKEEPALKKPKVGKERRPDKENKGGNRGRNSKR